MSDKRYSVIDRVLRESGNPIRSGIKKDIKNLPSNLSRAASTTRIICLLEEKADKK